MWLRERVTAHSFVLFRLTGTRMPPDSRGMELFPSESAFVANRALTRMRLGRWGDALADCQAVLLLDGRNAKALARAGRCLFELGRVDEAHDSYQRAAAIDPACVELQSRWRVDRARTSATRLTGSVPQPSDAPLMTLHANAWFQQAREPHHQPPPPLAISDDDGGAPDASVVSLGGVAAARGATAQLEPQLVRLIRVAIDRSDSTVLVAVANSVEARAEVAPGAARWSGKAFVWSGDAWVRRRIVVDGERGECRAIGCVCVLFTDTYTQTFCVVHMAGAGALRLVRFSGVCSGETVKHNFFVALHFHASGNGEGDNGNTGSARVLAFVLERRTHADDLLQQLSLVVPQIE